MDRIEWLSRNGVAFALGACTAPVARFVIAATENSDSTTTNEEELVGLAGVVGLGILAGLVGVGRAGWVAVLLGVLAFLAVSVVPDPRADPENLLLGLFVFVLLGVPALLGYGMGRIGLRLYARVRQRAP